MSPDHEALLRPVDDRPYDVHATLRWLRCGAGDPTWGRQGPAWIHACRTAGGPVSARFVPHPEGVRVQLWGPGTEDAVARLPAWVGTADDTRGFQPTHRWVARAWAAHGSWRLVRAPDPLHGLWITVLYQRVTWREATRSWRGICMAWGEPAPGPWGDHGLRVAPPPETVARLPYEALHPMGVEQKRARTLAEVAARAAAIRSWCDAGAEAARGRLALIPGIGPWTLASFLGGWMADADAVPLRDAHLPNTVAWALQGQARSDDAEMLRLLAPFRPHRGRVLQLMLHAGVSAPKRGPKRRSGWVPGY